MNNVKIPIVFEPFSDIRKSVEGKDAYAHCHNGHKWHKTKIIDIDLNGDHKGISDVPFIPQRLSTHFPLKIYKWEDYCDDTFSTYKEYCNAQDSISWSLDIQGTFEGYEVPLVRDIFSKGDKKNVVIDYGSHIGWYSIQAALAGYRTAAIDADYECNRMVKDNASLNEVEDKVFIYSGYIDETSPTLPANAETVHFWKCDIEGLEEYALAMSKDLFKAQKINYAMIEVSPCFNDTYPNLVEEIAACGYKVYQVPHKGWERTDEYAEQPLETLKRYCEIPAEGRREYVESLRQEDFVFIREEL